MTSQIVMDLPSDAEGKFIQRRNRFLGVADVGGEGGQTLVHIHDPGRLSEILFPGNRVLLRSAGQNPKRKTGWDLLAGLVKDRWVLANSSYHRHVSDWLLENRMMPFQSNEDLIRPETVLGRSRMDYMLDNGSRRCWVEVKGCSLSVGGTALFPDAPTKRGARHVSELIEAVRSGEEGHIIFLVFAPYASVFSPNTDTDPLFSERLAVAVDEAACIRSSFPTMQGPYAMKGPSPLHCPLHSFISLANKSYFMKDEVYYGKGMRIVREKYPELYEGINKLNGVIYTGRELDYKTQKLIAIGIVASKCDENATEKQMRSGMAELGITEGEIVDILRVVLLTAGMPAFNKGIRILEDILKK